jgi:hypothetical protein
MQRRWVREASERALAAVRFLSEESTTGLGEREREVGGWSGDKVVGPVCGKSLLKSMRYSLH